MTEQELDLSWMSQEQQEFMKYPDNLGVDFHLGRAKDQDEADLIKTALNPNTPIEVLKQLATHDDEDIRTYLSWNWSLTPELFNKLSQDESSFVCKGVASNPKAPVELLESISKSEDDYLRELIAGNENTPPAVLEALAVDSDDHVREMAASNPNTPASRLIELARHPHGAHYEIALNEGTPPEALSFLLFHQDDLVRTYASENPSLVVAPKINPASVGNAFLEQTAVPAIFNDRSVDEYVVTANILLVAAREHVALSVKSFEKAFNAVTNDGADMKAAVSQFGEPMA